MKRVIALRGTEKKGKSQTIKKVYELILSKYSVTKIYEQINRVDIKCVLLINGKKIGIESQGDPGPNSRIKTSLKYFVEINCQIIICATRTYGQTETAVNTLSNNYEIVWIDKTIERKPDYQDSVNLEDANKIIKELEKALAQ